jgi:hypothetical protein
MIAAVSLLILMHRKEKTTKVVMKFDFEMRPLGPRANVTPSALRRRTNVIKPCSWRRSFSSMKIRGNGKGFNIKLVSSN